MESEIQFNDAFYLKIFELTDAKTIPSDFSDLLLTHDKKLSFEAHLKSDLDKDTIFTKVSLLLQLKPAIKSYIDSKGLNIAIFIQNFWNFYLPFSQNLIERHQKNKKPLIQGILGVQGAGKTTFAEITTLILSNLGLNVVPFSIDDIYKTYSERQKIKEKDPRLRWRGPPGTHDVDLASNLLKAIKKGDKGPFFFPVFDKSLFGGEGDRVKAVEKDNVDIVLFEGWFLGMRPLKKEVFENRNDLYKSEEEVLFAKDMSAGLEEYLELWDLLDHLIVLWPESIEMSKTWRVQAEENMKKGTGEGKSSKEIIEFVDYFWKALHPTLYLQEMMENKRISFRFISDVQHRLAKIESFL